MYQALTTTPTALSGVPAGTRYMVQNKYHRSIYLERGTAAPTTSQGAFVLPPTPHPLSVGTINLNSGENAYIWTDSVVGGAGGVAYDEAA